jgi:hypothetical protein
MHTYVDHLLGPPLPSTRCRRVPCPPRPLRAGLRDRTLLLQSILGGLVRAHQGALPELSSMLKWIHDCLVSLFQPSRVAPPLPDSCPGAAPLNRVAKHWWPSSSAWGLDVLLPHGVVAGRATVVCLVCMSRMLILLYATKCVLMWFACLVVTALLAAASRSALLLHAP